MPCMGRDRNTVILFGNPAGLAVDTALVGRAALNVGRDYRWELEVLQSNMDNYGATKGDLMRKQALISALSFVEGIACAASDQISRLAGSPDSDPPVRS